MLIYYEYGLDIISTFAKKFLKSCPTSKDFAQVNSIRLKQEVKMQNNKSIGNLIREYQSTKSEDVFNKIYLTATANWKSLFKTLSKSFPYIDETEIDSMAHVKLYEITVTYDNSKGDFYHYLSAAIRKGCLYLARKQKHRNDHESLVSAKTDDEGNEIEFFDTIERANAEDEALDSLQKNSDQRQLIAALLSNADSNTRQSVEAFMMSDSFRDAAKLLGKKDKNSVIRPIRKLSRKYDGNQFGDIQDYFTVATEKVG
jgi:hypothetical protein